MQGNNGLEWRDFVSSRGIDGQYHGDINKLGQVTGIAFGSWAIVLVSANAKSDFTGFAAVLFTYFAFVGGASGYSAYLRSKQNTVETKTVVEPAETSEPQKTTTTVTERSRTTLKNEPRSEQKDGNTA